MIDISCKFYSQKLHVYAYYINSVESIIEHQKCLLTWRKLPIVAHS